MAVGRMSTYEQLELLLSGKEIFNQIAPLTIG